METVVFLKKDFEPFKRPIECNRDGDLFIHPKLKRCLSSEIISVEIAGHELLNVAYMTGQANYSQRETVWDFFNVRPADGSVFWDGPDGGDIWVEGLNTVFNEAGREVFLVVSLSDLPF